MRIHLSQTDSTNRVAKEEAIKGAASGTVVRADSQVAGKGQYGRSFVSPTGGLYFSLILRPALSPDCLPLITLATGLACRDALAHHFNVDIQLKWPNDLFLQGKKLGGILCETLFESHLSPGQATVIIGVGINCQGGKADFPEELQPLVTTLGEEYCGPIDLPALLEILVTEIQATVLLLPSERSSLLDRWQKYDYLLGQPLRYRNGAESFTGIGKGIGNDGCYRLVDAQGSEHAIIGGQLRPLYWPEDERTAPRQLLGKGGKEEG